MDIKGCNRYSKWIQGLVCAALGVFLLIFLYHMISDVGYEQLVQIPREYREAAGIEMERYILDGNNPYAVSNLQEEVPGPVNDYPFLYYFTVAGIQKIVHTDLLMLNYGFSIFCIIASGILLAWIAWKKTNSLWYSILACILGINCHWRGGYVAAHPDDMALFLMILLLFLFSIQRLRGQEFLSALIVVLLFYTKQYYVILTAPLLLYFLSRSKKKAIKFCTYGILLALGSAILITIFFPLYWMYGICNTMGYVDYKTLENLLYSLSQYKSFGVLFIGQFVPIIIYILLSIRDTIQQKRKVKWNLKNINEPLFYAEGDSYLRFLWYGFWCNGVLLLYFGLNKGAFGTYFLQLWGAFVILLGAYTTEELLNKLSSCSKIERGGCIYWLCSIAVSSVSLLFVATKMNIIPIDTAVLQQWEYVYQVVDESEGDIYYSPLLAFKGFENNDYVYNTGMAPVSNISESSNPVSLKYYPEYAAQFNQQHIDFQKLIRERAAQGGYTLITRVDGMDNVIGKELLEESYQLNEIVKLPCGNHVWDLEFWILK